MPLMNAWEPIGTKGAALKGVSPSAPFFLRRAAAEGQAPPTPLVFASPHSGRDYPADMMAATALDAQAIRRSEDAFVDDLIEPAHGLGVPVIAARYARAYIDLNREAFELDPGMFEDELPEFARARTARVAAGLGAIARVVSEGQEIYARKLTFEEARGRIEGAHRPYHLALERLIAVAQKAHGFAILIDWHSMPSAAARSPAAHSDAASPALASSNVGNRRSSRLHSRAASASRPSWYRAAARLAAANEKLGASAMARAYAGSASA